MNKLRKFLIILPLLLVSCTSEKLNVHQVHGDSRDTDLITLTVRGESHEFVLYHFSDWHNGIAHWPGCKYCNSKIEH